MDKTCEIPLSYSSTFIYWKELNVNAIVMPTSSTAKEQGGKKAKKLELNFRQRMPLSIYSSSMHSVNIDQN